MVAIESAGMSEETAAAAAGGWWWGTDGGEGVTVGEGGEVAEEGWGFPPPPPRPAFPLLSPPLTSPANPCELCLWAAGGPDKRTNVPTLKIPETSGEFGWVILLIVVSIISATIGAAIMILALHCRRDKTQQKPTNEQGHELGPVGSAAEKSGEKNWSSAQNHYTQIGASSISQTEHVYCEVEPRYQVIGIAGTWDNGTSGTTNLQSDYI